MRKKIPFKTYRFHLVPVKSDQLKAFGTSLTFDELKEKKNDIFKDVITKSKSIQGRSSQLPIEIEYSEGDMFILKLAIDRKTTLYKNFKPVDVENQPFIYLFINNDPEIQKILIEDNKTAFADTSTVRNILATAFGALLSLSDLTIHIEPVIDNGDFWDFVKKHEKSIESLDFEIVKPNLANISKSLTAPLKELIDLTNSHKTSLKLRAPDNGVLENISPKNVKLNGLVDYSNQGGGDGIRMKIKGLKKTFSTKNMVKEVYIESVEIETSSQQAIIDRWQKLFE